MRLKFTALVIALLASASGAQAHTKLLSSAPRQGAEVAAPAILELTFSEKLEPKFSKVTVAGGDGSAVASASRVVGKDRKSMTAKPSRPLGPGPYTVTWQAVTADGHKMTGSYKFVVK